MRLIFIILSLYCSFSYGIAKQDSNFSSSADTINDSLYRLFGDIQSNILQEEDMFYHIPPLKERFFYLGLFYDRLELNKERNLGNTLSSLGLHLGFDLFQYISFDFSFAGNNILSSFKHVYESVYSINALLYPHLKIFLYSVIIEPYIKLGFNFSRITEYNASSYSTSIIHFKRSSSTGMQIGGGLIFYLPDAISNIRLRLEYFAANNDSVNKVLRFGGEYLTGYTEKGYIKHSGLDRRYNFIANIPSTVYFSPGESEVIVKNNEQLSRILGYLRNDHNLGIFIAGYADSFSSENFSGKENGRLYAINLSKKRSERVREYLLEKGIAKEKIVISWYGLSNLNDEELESVGNNRRVTMTLFRLFKTIE